MLPVALVMTWSFAATSVWQLVPAMNQQSATTPVPVAHIQVSDDTALRHDNSTAAPESHMLQQHCVTCHRVCWEPDSKAVRYLKFGGSFKLNQVVHGTLHAAMAVQHLSPASLPGPPTQPLSLFLKYLLQDFCRSKNFFSFK